jgi:hypothetical protein
MNTILTPQARDFLCASVCEILSEYHVSPSVAEKLADKIALCFNNKIVRHLQEVAHVNALAVVKEALDQCPNN